MESLLLGEASCWASIFIAGLDDQRHLFDMEKLLSNERISMNKLTMRSSKIILSSESGLECSSTRIRDVLKYNERVPEKYRQPPENIVPSPHNTYRTSLCGPGGSVSVCSYT